MRGTDSDETLEIHGRGEQSKAEEKSAEPFALFLRRDRMPASHSGDDYVQRKEKGDENNRDGDVDGKIVQRIGPDDREGKIASAVIIHARIDDDVVKKRAN